MIAQEYVDPLLVLSGKEYARITFDELHERICDVLRGDRPRVAAEILTPGGGHRIVYDEEDPRVH